MNKNLDIREKLNNLVVHDLRERSEEREKKTDV